MAFRLGCRFRSHPLETNRADHKPNSIPWGFVSSLALSPDGLRLYSQLRLVLQRKGFATLSFNTENGEVVWERAYLTPPEDGNQNPPGGLILNKDGSRVYVAGTHLKGSPEQWGDVGSFVVVAYDAMTGATLWSRNYNATQTGCAETWVRLQAENSLVLSPSGDLLYLAGFAPYFNGCATSGNTAERVTGAAVFALRSQTGDIDWATYHGGYGITCINDAICNVAVTSGPDGGDVGSQVFVTGEHSPPNERFGYAVTFAAEGTTGQLLWQARYLDTFNDTNTLIWPFGGTLVGPDDTHLYVLTNECSATRGWRTCSPNPEVMQVIGYDVRLPDLTPTSLTVSKGRKGYERVLTATVTTMPLT